MADLLKMLKIVENEEVEKVKALCQDYVNQFVKAALENKATTDLIKHIEDSMMGAMAPMTDMLPELRAHVHQAAVTHVVEKLTEMANNNLKEMFDKNKKK